MFSKTEITSESQNTKAIVAQLSELLCEATVARDEVKRNAIADALIVVLSPSKKKWYQR